MSVWNKFIEIFSEGEKRPARLRARQEPPLPHAQSSELDLSPPVHIEAMLAKLLREHTEAASGKIHLLDLERIRERFGAKWERVTDMVHTTIRSAIDRNLSDGDFSTRYNDTTYVLVLRGVSEDQGRIRCGAICRDILGRLFGADEDSDILQVRTAVSSGDGDFSLSEISTAELFANALEYGERHTVDEELLSTSTASDDASGKKNGNSERAAQVEAAPQQNLEWAPITRIKTRNRGADDALASAGVSARIVEAVKDFDPAFTNLEQELGRQLALEKAQKRTTPERKVDPDAPDNIDIDGENPGEYPSQDAKPMEIGPCRISVLYRPMWNTTHNVISAYSLYADLTFEGRHINRDHVADEKLSEAALASLDMLLLRNAIDNLLIMQTKGRTNVLKVPIHFSTVSTALHRRDFVRFCSLLPDAIRRLIVWEIVGMPPGIWQNQVFVPLSLIRPFCRATVIRTSIEGIGLSAFAQIGVHAVGCDVPEHLQSEELLLTQLSRFAARTAEVGLRSYVHNCPTHSVVTAAVCAGFHYIDGPPILLPVSQPFGMRPFRPIDLYRQDETKDESPDQPHESGTTRHVQPS